MSSNVTAASIGMSLGATAGIGNMGTNLQSLTAYPLIALVALNIARRRLDRNRSWSALEQEL
jgi:nitrate/nitrite transporter NarK